MCDGCSCKQYWEKVMPIMMPYYTLLLMTVFLTVAAQILFKKASMRLEFNRDFRQCLASLFNKYFITGLALICLAPFLSFIVYSKIELSIGYIFTSLNYILVVLGSAMFLKESVNRYHLVGIVLIALGIILSAL